MGKFDDALDILTTLGMPRQQLNERSAYTLLALAGLTEHQKWSTANDPLLRVWDIMAWMREQYEKDYAANSRETIRRQTLHQFEQAGLIERNPDKLERPSNSGQTVYCLSEPMLKLVRTYGKRTFTGEVERFLKSNEKLSEMYQKRRDMHQIPVILPTGGELLLSSGKHNLLQKQAIEQFASRYAPGASLLYLGDTAEKQVLVDQEGLQALSITVTEHDKLPDIILYAEQRNWLFLIEAVTSHGPFSPKRHKEIEEMLASCPALRVYVTAFLTFADYRKYAAEIAWETEVWIAEAPDHLIHYNGHKFLGPPTPPSG